MDHGHDASLDRLGEWIHAMPGPVSRIVCQADYEDYLDIVANRMAKKDKLPLPEIPAKWKKMAYAAARWRARKYLGGDKKGARVGPYPGLSKVKGPGCASVFLFLAGAAAGVAYCVLA